MDQIAPGRQCNQLIAVLGGSAHTGLYIIFCLQLLEEVLPSAHSITHSFSPKHSGKQIGLQLRVKVAVMLLQVCLHPGHRTQVFRFPGNDLVLGDRIFIHTIPIEGRINVCCRLTMAQVLPVELSVLKMSGIDIKQNAVFPQNLCLI